MTTKQIIINTVVFAAGAAIGSAVTWKIMKTRCDQHIREEVEAFKKDWPKYAKGQNDTKVEPNDHWDGWNGCEEEDDDEDDDFDLDDEDDGYYEIECPSCGEIVCFDESLDPEELTCPACGEKISDVELCDGDCESCDEKSCEV